MSAGLRRYVATFFTHFDAICFAKELDVMGLEPKLMPVPRRLSSSCGTCVAFAYEGDPMPLRRAAMEQLTEETADKGYATLWDNRNGEA